MALKIPPGIAFLLSQVPKLLSPGLALLLVYQLYRRNFEGSFSIPIWLQSIVFLASVPATFATGIYWKRWMMLREANSMGAVMPPTVPYKWPGGYDKLKTMFKNERTSYIADFATMHSKELGNTHNFRLLFEDRIVTSEPEIIKSILATEFNNWEKGDTFKSIMQPLLGVGVFNSDGDMWKFHRSMTRPFFSKERISHFEVFGRHADKAIALMKARLRTGHSIDFQDLVSRFTLDSATEFLFNKCVHVLEAGLPYSPVVSSAASIAATSSDNFATRFSEAFSDAQIRASKRGRFGSAWPLFSFWGTRTDKSMEFINSFIEPIMDEAVAKRKAKADKGESKPKNGTDDIDDSETFLDNLVKYTQDATLLRDEILNIMIAGRDTTAATLTFAVYCLAMHPEALAKLREEILRTVGSERRPTYDELRDMKYLRAVINETLRLYPPVPNNSRCTINATTLPNSKSGAKPWYVPAKTRVTYSVLLMHRRKDLWGPDAHEFDPDRFLDERLHKYLTPNPFIFLPFNAGPRICLGQQFAYHETSYMLIRLLQSFSGIALADDEQPPASRPPAIWKKAVGERKSMERIRPKSHLTMFAVGGLWVRMTEAPPVEVA